MELKVKKLEHFVNTMEIGSMGETTIAKIVEKGCDSIGCFVRLTPQHFIQLERVGQILADKMYNEIQSRIKNARLSVVMAASNIFPGIGVTRFDLILEQFPDLLVYQGNTYDALLKIKGIGNELATIIVNGLRPFIEFLMNTREITIEQSVQSKDDILTGLTVLFTEVRDKALKEEIIKLGGKVKDNWSSEVNLVITQGSKESGKIKSALKANVPIIQLSSITDVKLLRQYIR
jgi:NAD-dependent DNA ligase